jgi:exosortase
VATIQTKPQIDQAASGTVPFASRLSAPQWTAIALITAAFIGLFWEWMFRQHRFSWDGLDDWGHAYVVPFICLYIAWTARERLLAAPRRAFWPALPPLLMGVASYVFFIVGVSNHMLQGFSLILVLGSVLLLTLGPRAFRFLFLPVLFLVFAITISEQVMIKLTFPLQLIASQGAYWLMSAGATIWSAVSSNDFLVTLKGNTLVVDFDGKSHPLNVAEACSGMRMVIAFLALAATVGLFGCKLWWQRITLFLIATPVAVVLNIFRVALLGFLTLYDPGLATGDAHMIIGTLLLVPGLFAFMGLVWALNRCIAEEEPEESPSKAVGKTGKGASKGSTKGAKKLAAKDATAPKGSGA